MRTSTVGIGFGYARVSERARGFDRDTRLFTGVPGHPIRSSETAFEANYQGEVLPGWTVQPFVQNIVRPGGGVLDPERTPRPIRIGNAAIFGVRTSIRY